MLCRHFEQIVPVTHKEGEVLQYLNFRIISTEQGVSFDQTKHIKDNVISIFFNEEEERFKTQDTPFRTDSTFERELQESLPATGKELARLEKEFKGSCLMHIGTLGHVAQMSRFDISYATTRLDQLSCAPSEAAFIAVKQIYRYLATYPHMPIFYPRNKIHGTQEIRYDYDPGNFHRMIVSNNLSIWPDADHARDQRTRQSMTCVIALLLCVIVHWKMEQQKCIAAHTTDSEVQAFYTGTKINQYLRAGVSPCLNQQFSTKTTRHAWTSLLQIK
jgi:hypothetical protein